MNRHHQLIIVPENCIGCELCILHCALTKSGSIQPAVSRIRIIRDENNGILMPVACRHCPDPLCLTACPIDDCITVDPVDGRVHFSEPLCIGCRKCVRACPYAGPVRIDHAGRKLKNIKVICDLCDGDPVCVKVCPTDTLRFERLDDAQTREKTGREAQLAVFLKNLPLFDQRSMKGEGDEDE
jgi:anaerobic carbon-monoxide dehydrogenase iron sulfur subunit